MLKSFGRPLPLSSAILRTTKLEFKPSNIVFLETKTF